MPHPLLRELPPVGALLDHPQVSNLARGRRRVWVTRVVQGVIEDLRREMVQDADSGFRQIPPDRDRLADLARQRILDRVAELLMPASRRVINATGVVVHTNLGRSCWPQRAVQWAADVAAGNSDLEFVLETNKRGHRGRKIEAKLALLCGSEDALVVNNNAAALWLAVRHATAGGRLVLSRGEVVAIGGSFRLHEILGETHCELVEVGTTNRTTSADYAEALMPGTTVLKVHRSNFAVTGFTAEVDLQDLAVLCRSHGCRLIYDAGSGALFPPAELGLPAERALAADLAAGADLVTCSGDKLLGGCQAGIILGSAREIAHLRRHPMRRTFRGDKTTLAALDAVLTLYLEAEDVPALPTLQHLARSMTDLQQAAADLQAELRGDRPEGWSDQVVSGTATVGGGSFSAVEVPTCILLWKAPHPQMEAVHRALRTGEPAVVARMSQEGIGIDLRTVAPQEYPLLAGALRDSWRRLRAESAEVAGNE
jgi:L-seryl-tRNA(Ser) seleniumtransferase